MLDRHLDILIIDDHDLIRRGAVDLLSTLANEVHIDDVPTLTEAEDLLRDKGSYDVIVLDLRMPEVKDFDALLSLKSISPQSPIAIVSGVVELEVVHAAFENGADGYIPKSSPAAVMLQAINLILQGELYIPSVYLGSPEFQQNHSESPNQNVKQDFASLTPRQNSVLELIDLGLSNKEIATKLSCAESTVKTHVSSILASIGVSSRGKLIAAYSAMKQQKQ